MAKAKLNEKIKFLEDVGNIDFIQGKEVELTQFALKDYSMRQYLFTGNIVITDGEVSFPVKEAYIYIAHDLYPLIYGKQWDKFFIKDLTNDTISWHSFDELPKKVQDHFNPKVIIVPEVKGDINKDGVFDKKDITLAAKILNEAKIDPNIFVKKKTKK